MSRISCLVTSIACALSLLGTTAAHAALIAPVGASASSTWNLGPTVGWVEVESVIDGSGITGEVTTASLHSSGYPAGGGSNFHWHTAQNDLVGHWIEFDLGDHYNLTSLVVWNFNAEGLSGGNPVSLTSRGFKDFNIRVSTNHTFGDGDDVLLTGFVMDQAQSHGAADLGNPAQIIAFDAANVRYVRLEPLTNYGNAYTGLSEVRFEGTAVPEPASMALVGLGGLMLLRRRRAIG